jgi:hypothetical protein
MRRIFCMKVKPKSKLSEDTHTIIGNMLQFI